MRYEITNVFVGPSGGDLNVTGNGINPHNNNDLDFTEHFENIIQVSSNWGFISLLI